MLVIQRIVHLKQIKYCLHRDWHVINPWQETAPSHSIQPHGPPVMKLWYIFYTAEVMAKGAMPLRKLKTLVCWGQCWTLASFSITGTLPLSTTKAGEDKCTGRKKSWHISAERCLHIHLEVFYLQLSHNSANDEVCNTCWPSKGAYFMICFSVTSHRHLWSYWQHLAYILGDEDPRLMSG